MLSSRTRLGGLPNIGNLSYLIATVGNGAAHPFKERDRLGAMDAEPTEPVRVVIEETPIPPGPANPAVEVRNGNRDALGRLGEGNTVGKQWYKGQPSANPGGRPKNETSVTAEAKRLLSTLGAGGLTNAAHVAQKLLDLALAGNVEALRYLSDRTDGKPAQAVTLSLDEGPLHYRLAVRDGGPRLSAAPPDDDAS